MKETAIPLWKNKNIESSLTVCACKDGDSNRPVVLVVPGGGYGAVCRSSEGDPVAARFSSLGFRTFILHYRVSPNRYPAPQHDITRAIRLIRYHAAEWGVLPDQIAVCGFSAGGHLCASAGILGDEIEFKKEDAADKMSSRPDAMILCYPVITSGKYAHDGSFQNLLGKDYSARKKRIFSGAPCYSGNMSGFYLAYDGR